MFKNKILLRIKGKNYTRFLKRLHTNKIEVFKIQYIKYDEITILINYNDYDNLKKLQSIYEVTEEEIYGIIKIYKVFNLYKFILLCIVLNLVIIIFLSNVIFNVEVIHADLSIRQLILQELEIHGLTKYKFKKSFLELEQIKDNILNKYKDTIEWLEIISDGTTYIIRVEERIINNSEVQDKIYNVTTSKDAIIKEIHAESGSIIKDVNNYVQKGEVVISSEIKLNDEIKDYISAEGKIYGEVWYTITVDYPFNYNELITTANKKTVYTLDFINSSFEFNKAFENKNIDSTSIFKHFFLPISFNKEIQQELIIKDYYLDEEEALLKAYEKAIANATLTLDSDEYIISSSVLSKRINQEGVSVTVFLSVFENITQNVEVEVPLDDS